MTLCTTTVQTDVTSMNVIIFENAAGTDVSPADMSYQNENIKISFHKKKTFISLYDELSMYDNH